MSPRGAVSPRLPELLGKPMATVQDSSRVWTFLDLSRVRASPAVRRDREHRGFGPVSTFGGAQ